MSQAAQRATASAGDTARHDTAPANALPLPVVDGRELPEEVRRLLRPGELLTDGAGRRHRLPRWFYEIASAQVARETTLAPYFGLYELITVDVREPEPLRGYPRYVPLTLTHLAAHLSALRQHLGTFVHVAANGGYRSPAHELNEPASAHVWGTAANLYRIGDDFLDSEETIGRYTAIVREVLPAAWCRPWGREPGGTIDHLHLDLGRLVVAPRDVGVEDEEEADDA